MRHRNIIGGQRCWYDQGEQLQVLLMDCAEYGDLGRLIKTFKVQYKQNFTRDKLLCLLVQASEGLAHAHN